MFKIPSKLSVSLSIALSIAFFCACIAGAIIMPYLTDMLIDIKDNIGFCNEITISSRIFVLIMAYFMLAVIMLADIMLFMLLLRVRHGDVFTSGSVALIRGVSWCCFLLCFAFLGLGIYFQLALILAFAALFLGLCIRVVKNVIEEATEIKSENDLTV